MSRLPRPSALLATTAAGALVALSGVLPAAATPSPSPTPAAQPAQYTYPPLAPRPTSTANSPQAPDPNPPRGGIGPLGEPVGGARLLTRKVIAPAQTPALPQGINAQSWILVDLDNGNVLAARDPHGRYQPASIFKTLLSITVLPLLPAHKVIIAAGTEHAEGSAAGLVDGGKYTTDELFEALLLVSGNDAAAALATAAGGISHTVDLMNKNALALGAYDTYAQTPSGLDGWQQLTSAYDMALFLREAVNMPRFIEYDEKPTVTLPPVTVPGASYGSVQLQNQSLQFLTSVPGALVVKTGFTDAARHTYLAAMKRGDRRIGVVLLRGQQYPMGMREQAVALMNWGLALPSATQPVGRLDPAVQPSAPASKQQTSRHAAAAAASSRRRSSGGTPLGVKIAVVAALLAAGGVLSRAIGRPSRVVGESS